MFPMSWNGRIARPYPGGPDGLRRDDMTPEERQMLADLFERIRGSAANPRDPQAEAFINDAVRAVPFAPYVLAQTVLVQQHALEGAAQRIAELEAQARSAAQQPAQETSFLGSIGRTIFGGPSAPPPPQPQAPRGYDASAYQRAPGPAPQGYPPQRSRRALGARPRRLRAAASSLARCRRRRAWRAACWPPTPSKGCSAAAAGCSAARG